MTKEIIKEIYEMNQEELYDYIKKYLDDKGIKYVEFDGNIYSIRFKDKVAFVSHLDTVASGDLEYHKPVFEYCGVLFKRNAILGADDRAGVNIILNHCENINFILTRDEEIGRLGAKSLRENNDFVNAINENNVIGFIEMDRRNNCDILGKKHGYCNEDFHKAIANILTDRTDEVGSVTDVDSFIDLRPAVNLSVGYHNPHSVNEFLDIEAWLSLNNKIGELNNISGEFSIPEKPQYTYTATGFGRNRQFLYSYPYNDYDDFGFSIPDNRFCVINEYFMEAIKQDFKYSLEHHVPSSRYNEPEEDITLKDYMNLIKKSVKYMECKECGLKIKENQRYHVINGEIYHDGCLEESEKMALGILKMED